MRPVVLASPMPRLERLLSVLGVPVVVLDSGCGGDPPTVPDGFQSSFAVHQLREALVTAGIEPTALTPRSLEGRRWKDLIQDVRCAPLVEGAGALDPELGLLPELEGALDAHQVLELRLIEHRLCLMRADVDAALRSFFDFDIAMRHHLDVEDQLIAEPYAALVPVGGWPRGAAPDIYANEHRKIRSKLDDFSEALAALAARRLATPERAAVCLELLDRQKVFADLLEHHDLRERAFIYPALEAGMPLKDKRALVDAILQR